MRRFIVREAQDQQRQNQRQFGRCQRQNQRPFGRCQRERAQRQCWRGQRRQEEEVRTKIYLNGEIRSFPIDSFGTLVDGLKHTGVTNLGTSNRIEYKDVDGDWIVLGSETEFKEARLHANPRLIMRVVQVAQKRQRQQRQQCPVFFIRTQVEQPKAPAKAQPKTQKAKAQPKAEKSSLEAAHQAKLDAKRAAQIKEWQKRELVEQKLAARKKKREALKKEKKVREAEAIWESVLGGQEHNLVNVVNQFLEKSGLPAATEKVDTKAEEPVKINIKKIDTSEVKAATPKVVEAEETKEAEETRETKEAEEAEQEVEQIEETEPEADHEITIEEDEEPVQTNEDSLLEEAISASFKEAFSQPLEADKDTPIVDDTPIVEPLHLNVPDIEEDREEPEPYQEEIAMIESMGFQNGPILKHLLKHNKGNVNAVIESLLKISAM